ncbi:MAG: AbrB family transcriptional regulator [Rhizobiales bacterium]|nr:AbrB family transcriptional regulator [Hyphomicrobiales bacterium]
MVPPSIPAKHEWWRTAETLAIGAAAGLTLNWLNFPAGLITGSLIGVAAAALAGRPLMIPTPLSRAIYVVVGISIGAVVTPETLTGLAAFPLAIAVLVVSTLIMIAATTSYLRFVHGWDWRTALFGASPGALAQVMTLAAEYKSDMRAVAFVQTIRVVALKLGIPVGLSAFGLTASGGLMARFTAAGPPSVVELGILVVVSVLTAWLFFRLRLPGGLIFGAMVASAILHGGGFIHAILPWWVAYAAVIGIGAITGSRFANTSVQTLARFLGAALGSFAVAMAIAAAAVLLLTMLMSVPPADAVVAFAPGAQDTMMVLALALHLDPVFVGALHLSRFLLVSLLVPVLAHKAKGPRLPQRKDADETQANDD